MDIFDELDAAFDNMLGDEPKEENASEEPIPQDLLELQEALAQDQLVPVLAIAGLMGKAPRRYVLAAMVGSLKCLILVDQNPEHQATMKTLQALVTTSKGKTRKVLRANQAAEIRGQLALLGGPVAESKTVATYLKKLAACKEITLDEVSGLFAAGLWQADFIAQAPLEDVVRLANLAEAKAIHLQQTCRA